MEHIKINGLKRVFFVAILGSFFFIGACKKDEWLNPDPSTLITDETAFATPERIANQVNGLYAKFKSDRFWGSWYLIASDIRAGDFLCTNLNAATGAITYQMLTQTTTEDVTNIWQYGYLTINTCNVFIDGVNVKGKEVLTEDVAQQYIAEARLLRAIAYYSLLQLYARPFWDGNGSKPGLPLRLNGNTTPGNYDLVRSSVAETYQQILADLDFAEDNLPASYSSAFLNTTRAHRNTAIALKTRVYLSMQAYDKVIQEANKIVSLAAPFIAAEGVKHSLESNIQNVFKAPYTSNESIFSMPFTNNDAPGQSLARYYLPGTADGGTNLSNGAGEYSLNPNGILSNTSWKETDARRSFVKQGPRSGKYWLFKFTQASPYTDYAPVIRYAEVLLNLSEALVRDSHAIDDRSLALLNAVRQRADTTTTFRATDFSGIDDFLTAIVEEREIEFLGEGLRNADLMRLGLSIPAKTQHAVPVIAPNAQNYIFPISSDELILNKLMVNN